MYSKYIHRKHLNYEKQLFPDRSNIWSLGDYELFLKFSLACYFSLAQIESFFLHGSLYLLKDRSLQLYLFS